MTTNSQPATTEPKKNETNKQTKQTTRTGTESQKWRTHGGLLVGERVAGHRAPIQGIRSINCRYKVDKGRSTIV